MAFPAAPAWATILCRAITRSWHADLPFCLPPGRAMLTDRAVSTDILDHSAVVRLAGFAPPALPHQGSRDPRPPPRSLSPTPPGRHTPPLIARPGDHVR